MKNIGVATIFLALLCVAPTGMLRSQDQSGEPLNDGRVRPAELTVALVTDPDWTGPRTSWGHPDLQGTWSTDDMRGIPRERPAELADLEVLGEAAFLERARAQAAGRDAAVNEETFLRNEWGTRTFGFTSLVVDPPDGRLPPLSEAGAARAEAARGRGTFGPGPFNDFDDFSLYDRCISLGINRGMGAAIYGNGIRIFQSPDKVTITYEMIHETRVIYLDGRDHLHDAVDQYTGNARGRWEGDTLIVESHGFTDRTSVGGRSPHSTNLMTTERIRRIDPEMIEYRITVDDPATYTAPFTVRTMWTTQPAYYVYEYSCHEGNGAVGNSLSGERAYERRVAEALANGEQAPPRSNGRSIYRAPEDSAEIFDINEGE